jgi:TPR repeat protein
MMPTVSPPSAMKPSPRPGSTAGRLAAIGFRAALLATALASPQALSAQGSPVLLEAIEWYTGVAGRVDDERAHRLLLDAVARDEPLARMWLARTHSRGRMGFDADVPKAQALAAAEIETVERLAGEGVLEAVFLMATAFDEGPGRSEDPAAAAVWLRRAAERGHVLAQHNLGNAHAAGRGVEQSDPLAVEWWLKAAAAGDAIPQLRLGEAYEAGRGVTRDMASACRWYGEAARRGDSSAVKALDRLVGTCPA